MLFGYDSIIVIDWFHQQRVTRIILPVAQRGNSAPLSVQQIKIPSMQATEIINYLATGIRYFACSIQTDIAADFAATLTSLFSHNCFDVDIAEIIGRKYR